MNSTYAWRSFWRRSAGRIVPPRVFSDPKTRSQASSSSRVRASLGAIVPSCSSGASVAQRLSNGTCSWSTYESRTSGQAPFRPI